MTTPASKNANKTRGAVIYTRVSTGEQDKHGTSPETQLDACRKKALALSLPIVAEYYDGGVSGGFLLMRTEFQSAIADIQAGRADTLICPSISRYSRDVEHQQAVKKAVKAAGGRLVFCDAEFEDTAAGDLNFDIQGSFAAYERKVIRERTMGGRKKHAEAGQQPARSSSPFGYHIVTKADVLRGDYPADQLGHYIVQEDQAQVVRELFTRYASGGDSLNQLARWLNAAGVKPSGKAVYWWGSGLRYLLKNTVYKGQAHYGQQTHRMEESRLSQLNPKTDKPYKQSIVRRPADADYTIDLPCPAIVGEDLWDQANARLSLNQSVFSGNPGRVRMLSGRIFCPTCGGRMATCGGSFTTYISASGKPILYPKEKRYTCMDSVKMAAITGQRPCPATFMARRVEEAALSAILSAARQDQSLKAALRAWERQRREALEGAGQGTLNKNLTQGNLKQEKARVEDALTALAARQEAAVKAQVAGIMAGASPDAYSSVFADIAAERKDLEDRRGQILREMHTQDGNAPAAVPKKSRSSKNSVENAPSFSGEAAIQAAHDVLTSPDVPGAKKRQIVGSLIEKVICQKDGAEVWFLPGVIAVPLDGEAVPEGEAEDGAFWVDTVQSMSMILARTSICRAGRPARLSRSITLSSGGSD